MTDGQTDEQLLSDVAGADGKSFRMLIDRHGRYLFGLARTLTRNLVEAEDVVQETLLALLTARFRGGSSARTFIISILVRQAALARRKSRGWLRFVARPDDRASSGSDQASADAKLDLAVLLERLSDEHREVIVMRELQAMSYDEIAAVLDVPRGTVESRLHRAREHLRTIWADDVDRTR